MNSDIPLAKFSLKKEVSFAANLYMSADPSQTI